MWIFLAYLLASSSLSPPEETEIRVQLSTQTALSPLYVGKIQAQGTSLSSTYLAELSSVLHFDLKHNGYSHLMATSPEKEELLSQLSAEKWQKMGAQHVLRPSVSFDGLSMHLLKVANGERKQFPSIALTGVLEKDRRQIHRLADQLQKELYGLEGIASTKILFSGQTKTGQQWCSEIFECDYDGHNARQVTHEGSYAVSPVYISSPRAASGKFLYVSYKQGQPKIQVASLHDGMGKRLVHLPGNQMLPSLSHSRDKLAFICDASGRTDLFLQNFHPTDGEMGKPIQLFSTPHGVQASPTFSPDGTKLAFVSDKDGRPRIYIIPTSLCSKRPQATLISKQNSESTCPAWSCDGKKIAYSAKTNGVRQIWVYDLVLKEEKQLTVGPGNKENPSWAPDSLHLVFNSTDGSSSELYLVNLNQPEAIKITRGPGKKHYPGWSPR